ncbi:hypothetical protein ABRP29_24870, partial [Pseudomonas sp. WHRI 8822A]|uniref:hypothetical protein n=1 Tax=Pseudomonas sp. WHRI 8822A TaxID=3162568 RepID=UPI0032EEF87B
FTLKKTLLDLIAKETAAAAEGKPAQCQGAPGALGPARASAVAGPGGRWLWCAAGDAGVLDRRGQMPAPMPAPF